MPFINRATKYHYGGYTTRGPGFSMGLTDFEYRLHDGKNPLCGSIQAFPLVTHDAKQVTCRACTKKLAKLYPMFIAGGTS